MKKLAKLFATTLASVTISLGSLSAVEINKIHFLIPGGAGGGWDGTARGTGEALTKA
ncbi:MAG: tripartite tricarboxylate transporter substrate binding protein, partial [SAR324 cluster bacterium]|nr:tripartite tricarboxylate transporter substrate binding protein [SAR324 cluster bacterium]